MCFKIRREDFYVLVLFLINSLSETSVQKNLGLREGMVLGLAVIELKE